MDYSLGELLAALREAGRLENTLVLFTSDNGGVLGSQKTKQTVGMNTRYWAYVARKAGLKNNRGVSGGKGSPLEGGTLVPYIVRWPGHVRPGISDTPVNLVDTVATLAEALALEIPSPADGAEDSISIYPAWRGTYVPRDEMAPFITTSVKGTFSIRQGGWKHIEGIPADKRVKGGLHTRRALYNLKKDPTERRNLIAVYPDSTARLQALLDRARSCPSTRPVD